MTKGRFEELSALLAPSLEPPAETLNPVSTDLCLSMTLRFLAGAHVLDILDLHGVAEATFYVKLHKVRGADCLCWDRLQDANALCAAPVGQTLLALDSLPELMVSDIIDDEAGISLTSIGFAEMTSGVMKGCIGGELTGLVEMCFSSPTHNTRLTLHFPCPLQRWTVGPFES